MLSKGESSSHEKAVERLFELTDMQQKVDESIDVVLAIQLRQSPQYTAQADTIRAFLEKYIGWEALKAPMTDMYLQTFTEAELNKLNAFYSTPEGQKVIKKLPDLVNRRNALAMQRLEANKDELARALEAAAAKTQ